MLCTPRHNYLHHPLYRAFSPPLEEEIHYVCIPSRRIDHERHKAQDAVGLFVSFCVVCE